MVKKPKPPAGMFIILVPRASNEPLPRPILLDGKEVGITNADFSTREKSIAKFWSTEGEPYKWITCHFRDGDLAWSREQQKVFTEKFQSVTHVAAVDMPFRPSRSRCSIL